MYIHLVQHNLVKYDPGVCIFFFISGSGPRVKKMTLEEGNHSGVGTGGGGWARGATGPPNNQVPCYSILLYNVVLVHSPIHLAPPQKA